MTPRHYQSPAVRNERELRCRYRWLAGSSRQTRWQGWGKRAAWLRWMKAAEHCGRCDSIDAWKADKAARAPLLERAA